MMACRALWNATSDESFHSDVLSQINFVYSTKESENKDAVCIFCNGKFSEDEEEKFGLSVTPILCGGTWALPEQKTQSMSVTFINRLEAEMVFA